MTTEQFFEQVRSNLEQKMGWSTAAENVNGYIYLNGSLPYDLVLYKSGPTGPTSYPLEPNPNLASCIEVSLSTSQTFDSNNILINNASAGINYSGQWSRVSFSQNQVTSSRKYLIIRPTNCAKCPGSREWWCWP